MKGSIIAILIAAALLFMPAAVFAESHELSGSGPPISQSLMREGTLAVKLVEALKLGTASSEAEAESMLSTVGIEPRSGWIADYPVTPDVVGELKTDIAEAAESGKLTMGKDESIAAFEGVLETGNLAVKPDTSGQVAEGQPGTTYPDSSVINNYYYNYGPPVVTYYAPPPYYADLYTWVPYPFWWWRVWFPGFFILVDFHKTIIVDRHVFFVRNHFFDRHARVFVRIHPFDRFHGRVFVDRFHGRVFVDRNRDKVFVDRRDRVRVFGHSGDRRGSDTTVNTGRSFTGREGPRVGFDRGRGRSGSIEIDRSRSGSSSGPRVVGPRSGSERTFSPIRNNSFDRRSDGRVMRDFRSSSVGNSSVFRHMDRSGSSSPSAGFRTFRAPSDGGRSFNRSSGHRDFSPSFGSGRGFSGGRGRR